MKTQALFEAFSRAQRWNALAYTSYKILATALSVTLYTNVSARDFSLWANINSTVFLLLLWIDGGLRKAIPRYAPLFAHTVSEMRRFMLFVITAQMILMVLALPALTWIIGHVAPQLLAIGIALFAIEGIVATLRLLYHAHFWNKQFKSSVRGLRWENIQNYLLSRFFCIMILWIRS